MKKPRLLNLAAGLSLLLAIAIVALWLRSYGRNETVDRFWHTSTERCSAEVGSCYGSIDFVIASVPNVGRSIAASYRYYDDTQIESTDTRLLQWFAFPPMRFQHDSVVDELTIAYWLLLLPTLPLPLLAIARHRRRRRRETNNLCPTCGYDLRATADRCPECGAIPARGVERTAVMR